MATRRRRRQRFKYTPVSPVQPSNDADRRREEAREANKPPPRPVSPAQPTSYPERRQQEKTTGTTSGSSTTQQRAYQRQGTSSSPAATTRTRPQSTAPTPSSTTPDSIFGSEQLADLLDTGMNVAERFGDIANRQDTLRTARRETGWNPRTIDDPQRRIDFAENLMKKNAVVDTPKRQNVVRQLGNRKTHGRPGVNQLAKAANAGKVNTTRDGRLVTEGQREATRQLSRAKKRTRDAGVEGPLTEGQKTFVESLSRKTGLDPKVVGGWALAEMSGEHATGREAEGNHNWLNIGFFDSGPGALTADSTWSDPESAAEASAQFLRGERYGASEGIQGILGQAGQSPEQQIQAIANSGWASSGYEGGQSLRDTTAMIDHEAPAPGARRALRDAVQQAQRQGVPLRPGGRSQPQPELGNLVVQGDADMENTSPAMIRFGKVVAGRVGADLPVSSAARPGSTTVSGNTSDHSSGNALDIPVLAVSEGGTPETEEFGNRVAYEAIVTGGGSQEQAEQMAANGGAISVTNEDGVRTQVIWRSGTGGNHYNHVHVGISGAEGEGGFEPGTGSFTGSLPGTMVGALEATTGFSAQQIDQAVGNDQQRQDRVLSGLGFTLAPTAARGPQPGGEEGLLTPGDTGVSFGNDQVSAILRRGRRQ